MIVALVLGSVLLLSACSLTPFGACVGLCETGAPSLFGAAEPDIRQLIAQEVAQQEESRKTWQRFVAKACLDSNPNYPAACDEMEADQIAGY